MIIRNSKKKNKNKDDNNFMRDIAIRNVTITYELIKTYWVSSLPGENSRHLSLTDSTYPSIFQPS